MRDMKYILTLWTIVLGTPCLAQAPDFFPQEDLIAWYAMGAGSMEESGLVPLQPVVFAEDRFGEADECILFDGEQEFITAGLSYCDFTISLWFRSEASSEDVCHGLISQNTGVDCTPLMHVASCNIPPAIRCQVRTTSCMADQVSADLNVLSWQHLVFQRQGNTIRTFLNGDLAEEGVAIEEDILPDVPLRIGSLPYGGQFRGFNGLIDDVAIWGRSLSEEEVWALFLGEAVLMGCTNMLACNFNPEANVDDNSCYSCEIPAAHCGEGTHWDAESQTCIVGNSSDTDFDGCVGMTDLLDLLSAFGTCNDLPWSCGDPLEYQGYDYETVQIGEQCWFAENLRGQNYRNGDELVSGLMNSEWTATNSGASAQNGEGEALYNWFAVNDSRGICPVGWSVPADTDWAMLESIAGVAQEEIYTSGFRGSASEAGNKLKAQDQWTGEGLDTYGFRATPSGFRSSSDGLLQHVGDLGFFWTSTELDGLSISRSLEDDPGIRRVSDNRHFGFSVRCIQNLE